MAGADESRRWRLIAEFLEDFRWESADARFALLEGEPAATGDERWDVFLAGLAEHLQPTTVAAHRHGSSNDRCGSCGSRSTPALPGWMRSSTRLRPSGGVACTLQRTNWTWRDRD